MMEAGLVFSTDAELTGQPASTLTLLLEGWNDDDDVDEDDDDDVWGAGRDDALGWG